MIQQIRYRGFSTNPDDYAVPDGDLEGVSGLAPEDEALRPIQPPAPLFDLPPGKTIQHVHQSPTFRHFILHDPETGDLAYTKDGGTIAPLEGRFPELTDIQSIGNTLLVLTPTGMHYFLYRDQRRGYLALGDQIPFPSVSFALATRAGEWTESRGEGVAIKDHLASMLGRARAKIYDQQGRFLFPFFVRYALRLYDGSTTRPSPPVLMIPSSANKYKFSRRDTTVQLIAGELRYAFDDPAFGETWQQWGDIVKSVDVFVSAPIYTWDQEDPTRGNAHATSSFFTIDTRRYSVSSPQTGDLGDVITGPFLRGAFPQETTAKESFRPWRLTETKTWQFDFQGALDGAYIQNQGKWHPLTNEAEVLRLIPQVSSFYLYHTIDRPREGFSLQASMEYNGFYGVKEGYLANLPTYETLRDDLRSHHKVIPQSAYVYNSRLNLAGLSEEILPDAHRWRLLPYTTPKKDHTLLLFFLLRGDDGEDITLPAGEYSGENLMSLLSYVYCPDPRAYKLVAFFRQPRGFPVLRRDLEMTKHDFLSGSYAFSSSVFQGLDTTPDWQVSSTRQLEEIQRQSATSRRIFPLPNKVYTSEVNNPFSFPTQGVNTIGTGTILGISAATKALSQGQFGQFPLYALSTDGVWALEVAKDGTYIARQPISRDVCINPGSITQIDNAVLFTSERGIMLLSGSQCICISDSLDPSRSPSLKDLPKSAELLTASGIPPEQTDHLPLKDFLQGAEMIYDYPRQRLLAYHPKTRYAYVYSLKSKQWSATPSDIRKSVNAYPQSLAVTKEGKVVDYSKEDPTKGRRGLLVTRPLKLGAPDTLKTVRSIIQRGYFRKGHVQSILYGSRDLFSWHLVASSQDHILRGFSGTPYKYFKVALLCSLDPDETIFGCTIEFYPRLTNKPR